MINRGSVIVFFANNKALNSIKNIANVTYVSKKRRYATIFVNEDNLQKVKKNLKSLKGVKTVLDSKHQFKDFSFETI